VANDLAHWQFATTSLYHFLFVPVTIGLAFMVAILQTAVHEFHQPDRGPQSDLRRRRPDLGGRLKPAPGRQFRTTVLEQDLVLSPITGRSISRKTSWGTPARGLVALGRPPEGDPQEAQRPANARVVAVVALRGDNEVDSLV
jgi:hypothetical protein